MEVTRKILSLHTQHKAQAKARKSRRKFQFKNFKKEEIEGYPVSINHYATINFIFVGLVPPRRPRLSQELVGRLQRHERNHPASWR